MKVDTALQQEQEYQAQRKANAIKMPFFGLKLNQSAKVRFLTEFGDGVVLLRHDKGLKKPSATCANRNTEEYPDAGDCWYCAQNEEVRIKAVEGSKPKLPYPLRKEFFWPVYNQTTKQVEFFSFRPTTFSPIPALDTFVKETGESVRDLDFLIRRVPAQYQGNDASSYVVMPMERGEFTLPEGATVPTREEIVQYFRPRKPKQ